MKLYPMDSGAIKAAGYDRSTNSMFVTFNEGKAERAYRYFNVPRTKYVQMRKARSQGRYFAKNIKGKFESQRLVQLGSYLLVDPTKERFIPES